MRRPFTARFLVREGGVWRTLDAPYSQIHAMAASPDGTLWALADEKLVRRYADGRWEEVALPVGARRGTDLAVRAADEIWVLAMRDNSHALGSPHVELYASKGPPHECRLREGEVTERP